MTECISFNWEIQRDDSDLTQCDLVVSSVCSKVVNGKNSLSGCRLVLWKKTQQPVINFY